jgi:hypothetical protein
MNIGDFTKYVIDNMHRATLVNSLNVSKKLIDGVYDVNEFIKISLEYVSELLSSNKMSPEIASRLSVAFYDCRKDYNSDFNYNKSMLLNDLIINMWEILGSKG